MIQWTEAAVIYASNTKLMELAFETAETRNLKKVSKQIAQGSKIFYWLQAIDSSEFLTKQERERIWYCLLSLSGATDYPISPILGNTDQPNVIVGGSNTIINNYTYNAGTPFEDTDVDTGSNTVDSFPMTSARGVVFHYNVYKGSNHRSGIITAGWLSGGSSIVSTHESTIDIGNTSDVILDVDFNVSNIRLIATAASNDWTVEGSRYLIPIA